MQAGMAKPTAMKMRHLNLKVRYSFLQRRRAIPEKKIRHISRKSLFFSDLNIIFLVALFGFKWS